MNSRKKKIFLIIIIVLLVTIILTYLSDNLNYPITNTTKTDNKKDTPSLIIAGGVVPHHLLAFTLIEEFFKKLSTYEGIENIIILSPDHYRKTEQKNLLFITANRDEDLIIKEEVIQQLINLNNKIGVDKLAVFNDQGINSLLEYLKKYFPKTPYLPLLISPLADQNDLKNLIENIITVLPKNTILIASVDFSHYLPDDLLKLHDIKSIRTLINFEEEHFPLIDVDSWQALYGIRYYARLKNQEKPIIVGYKTSYELISNLPPQSELAKQKGTSYFSVIFENGNPEKIEQISALIVGDIMMGRGVQLLTDKYGLIYPFEKIKNIFKGIDLVIGNLEGPLMKDATFISLKSVSFGYPLEIGQFLKKLGFNVLTLSNNHTLDKGQKALEETRKFLQQIGIQPVGDYSSCNKKYYYQYKNLVFIGANLVYQNEECIKEIIKNIQEIKLENPDTLLIFIPHWGVEYTHLPNDFQKKIAHKLIDNGIDLIVGHHPHVVQSIEVYKDKHIFYSLGNFVFDMYFSKSVQEGLGIGLKIKEGKIIINLIPFQSSKSQLRLLEDEEKVNFLNWLAEISPNILKQEIESGLIIQNINN